MKRCGDCAFYEQHTAPSSWCRGVEEVREITAAVTKVEQSWE